MTLAVPFESDWLKGSSSWNFRRIMAPPPLLRGRVFVLMPFLVAVTAVAETKEEDEEDEEEEEEEEDEEDEDGFPFLLVAVDVGAAWFFFPRRLLTVLPPVSSYNEETSPCSNSSINKS